MMVMMMVRRMDIMSEMVVNDDDHCDGNNDRG